MRTLPMSIDSDSTVKERPGMCRSITNNFIASLQLRMSEVNKIQIFLILLFYWFRRFFLFAVLFFISLCYRLVK